MPTSSPTRRLAAVGLVGSVLLATGALGVGYLPPRSRLNVLPIAEELRSTEPGRLLANLAVWAGVLVLLATWLRLWAVVRRGDAGPPDRLVTIFWVWAAPLVLMPPLFSLDLYSYTAQGNLLNVGYDPYEVGPSAVPTEYLEPVSTTWLDTPAPYGPGFLWLGSLTATVSDNHVYVAALIMRLAALVGVALIGVYLPRLAAAVGVSPSFAVWAGLLNPLVLMHFVSGAHNDALMVGLMVAALALALERRPLHAAVLLALGASVKAPAFVLLGFVGLAWAAQKDGTAASRLRTRLAAWVGVSSAAALVFVAVSAVAGLGLGWIDALRTPGMVKTWVSPVTALGRGTGDVLAALGVGDHGDTALSLVRGVAMLVLGGLVAWWLLRRRGIDPVRGSAVAMLLLGLFGPVLQSWYLLWGIVLLAAVPLGRRAVASLVLLTTVLAVNNLVQGTSTSDPLLNLSDGVVALATYAFAAALALVWPQVRADLLGRPGPAGPTGPASPAEEPRPADTVPTTVDPGPDDVVQRPLADRR